MTIRTQSAVLLAAAAAGCSATASGAPAPWRRPVLVELYTSQGCSSCPPADAFVRELPALGLGRDKVIPLTFHVDYWDRLGWKDRFAAPAFTERQEWYAGSGKLKSPDGAAGLDGLYTPQMIVNGSVHFSGQRRQTAVHEMERAAARPAPFDLTVETNLRAATLELTVGVAGGAAVKREPDWRVVAVLVAKKARTPVAHGENAGETLDEAAVVRALSDRVPLPNAGGPAHLQIEKPADLAWADVEVVVFAQSEATREIGAVRVVSPRP
jgi:hypothetical protein